MVCEQLTSPCACVACTRRALNTAVFVFTLPQAYNSSFVFVFLISLLVLREPLDYVKATAVVVCLSGMVLI